MQKINFERKMHEMEKKDAADVDRRDLYDYQNS